MTMAVMMTERTELEFDETTLALAASRFGFFIWYCLPWYCGVSYLPTAVGGAGYGCTFFLFSYFLSTGFGGGLV